jgi:tetratricopeptide (TPR) repeat protein
MSEAAERRDRGVALALGLALLVLAASVGAQKIRDFDYWWHLRTGQLIVETGAVPRTDPYTYTVPGQRWIDIHWLFQLGLHGVHSLGGHRGVVVAKIACIAGLVAILATIGWRRERAALTGLALGLMLAVAADRFTPRPELPSFLCLAALLALLARFERRPDAWLWAAVPIQVLWVNVHGLFALGLAVLAIHLAAEVVHPLVRPGEAWRAARLRRLGAVTLAAALASLANPNGIDGALYPLQQLGMIGPSDERGVFGSIIAELIPPLAEQHGASDVALALLGLLAMLSFLAMAVNWRRAPAADPLLWVAFLYLALGAQRNAALFAIVAAPILVRNLGGFLDARALPRRLWHAGGVVTAAALLALAADVARGAFFERFGSFREPGFGPLETLYPGGAVDWIERERPPGPICHHMADGGYLVWRLYPDYRAMTDGRLEVYGPERFLELQVSDPERFRALDQEFHFGAVLLHHSLFPADALLYWLHLNPTWRLVHVDDTAALFVRARPDGSGPPGLDVDADDLFPAFDDPPGVRDRVRRMARTNFYMILRRWERARALWDEVLARYPDLEHGPIVQATLLERTGFPAAAEAILRRLVAERPDDAVLHAEIGDLRFDAEDLAAARESYDRALRLDPDLAHALLRRGMLAERESDPEAAFQYYARAIRVAAPAEPAALQAAQRLRSLGRPIQPGLP